MSLRLRLFALSNRLTVKRALAQAEDPTLLRLAFDRSARRMLRPPPLTAITETLLAPGLTALRIRARPARRPPLPRRVLLYFHGGAFLSGGGDSHGALAARIARQTRLEVILPLYRLAPEHPFPAAVTDARTAFDALLARGYAPEDIVLGGDSAGGNLALGLLAGVLAEGLRPAGLFAFSPLTDLTFSSAAVAENAQADPTLPTSATAGLRRLYLAGADPADPRVSPLFAAYLDPPPVFLQVAGTEILRDDSLRLAEKLTAAGGEVTLDLWPDVPHAFAMFELYVPEAREALTRATDFVTTLFAAQAKAGDSASR